LQLPQDAVGAATSCCIEATYGVLSP
jgi:hypothetical protein